MGSGEGIIMDAIVAKAVSDSGVEEAKIPAVAAAVAAAVEAKETEKNAAVAAAVAAAVGAKDTEKDAAVTAAVAAAVEAKETEIRYEMFMRERESIRTQSVRGSCRMAAKGW